MGKIACTSKIIGNPQEVEAEWKQLLTKVDCEVFLSWTWVSNWLQHIIPLAETHLLRVTLDGETIALSVFHFMRVKRRVFFNRRLLYLNQWPEVGSDMCMEYNGMLAVEVHETSAWKEALRFFQQQFRWDEVTINAASPRSYRALHSACEQLGSQLIVDDIIPARMARLSPTTNSWQQTADRIFSKRRQTRIKRNLRLYEEISGGSVQCEEQDNTEQALDYFAEMGKLHNRYWQSKGIEGTFYPNWIKFHETIIKQCGDGVEAHVLRISTPGELIGYMYNLQWQNKIYNIQSGINYTDDNRRSTGIMCHWLAMRHYHAEGIEVYNLLAGDHEYKRSLTDSFDHLYWLRVLRGESVSHTIEDFLVRIVRQMRNLIDRAL